MQRDWEVIKIQLGDEGEVEDVTYLWRYDEAGTTYLYVTHEPEADTMTVRIFLTREEESGIVRVRDLASVQMWDRMMTLFRQAIKDTSSNDIHSVDIPWTDNTVTPFVLHTIVPLEGQEYVLYSQDEASVEEGKLPRLVAFEYWIENGIPHRELVDDTAILEQIVLDAGLLDDAPHANVTMQLEAGQDAMECEFLGTVEVDGLEYALISPLTDENVDGSIIYTYRYIIQGDKERYERIAPEVFDRVIAEANKLLSGDDDEGEEGEGEAAANIEDPATSWRRGPVAEG